MGTNVQDCWAKYCIVKRHYMAV